MEVEHTQSVAMPNLQIQTMLNILSNKGYMNLRNQLCQINYAVQLTDDSLKIIYDRWQITDLTDDSHLSVIHLLSTLSSANCLLSSIIFHLSFVICYLLSVNICCMLPVTQADHQTYLCNR